MQQLLNPFAQKYPEAVDGTLQSQAISIKFNPSGPFAGHYLAAGGIDGLVEIWDVETRSVARVLEGHVKPVGGLSWSKNNRYLLTSSLDSTAIIWDLSTLAHPSLIPKTPIASTSSSTLRAHTIRLEAPVANAVFHPRNSKIILATLTCNEVYLVDLRVGGGRWKIEDVMEGEGEAVNGQGDEGEEEKKKNVILSSSDRALRVLQVSPLTSLLTPSHRFQDLVNRTAWHSIGFSGDGEYVMGGAGHKMAHNVFIWDRESGILLKVLEGPKEPLTDCDWHPTRPVIASVTNSGDICIWQTTSPDVWAAFAPGFEELEENVEYDEREDEFDIEDETEVNKRKDAEEDLLIDVLSPQEDSFPRRPEPILAIPANMMEDEVTEENVRLMGLVANWSDREPDNDDWEGFYLSVDLLEPVEDTTEI
ncbi:COMPASS component SWD1, partial [Tremellales sp. Uapishka_1]